MNSNAPITCIAGAPILSLGPGRSETLPAKRFPWVLHGAVLVGHIMVGMYVTPQTPTSPLTQHTSKSYGSSDSRKGLGREQLNVQRSPRERCSRHAGAILQNPGKAAQA